jgi:hypothetical protein
LTDAAIVEGVSSDFALWPTVVAREKLEFTLLSTVEGAAKKFNLFNFCAVQPQHRMALFLDQSIIEFEEMLSTDFLL